MPNRLINESSPYLLQHAHNPVDWWPWGEAAFAEARRRSVPIFLSVGYSTCYWCHVMERESFEDDATAEAINRGFVPIKVDREERPDVDEIYMAAVQVLTGGGGWPMNLALEPQTLKPFWGGTYFPPTPGHGRPAFRQVLENLAENWSDNRQDILRQADRLASAITEHLGAPPKTAALSQGHVAQAVGTLLRSFDRVHGGFGSSPKFPQPPLLMLLLDVLPRAGDDATRAAITHATRTTLDRMAAGGVHDHLAGGFHRYSVDERWLVPHFEKMLYDNAQLAEVYALAGERFDDAHYRDVARRTLDYILREMTGPTGLFHSAQDAEVDGREGASYVWTRAEIIDALTPQDAAFALKVFGVEGGANFRDPHHPDEPPANVLRLDDRPDRLAPALGLTTDEFASHLDRIRAALLAARNRRKQPRLDDKSLTSWNGLTIAALARCAPLLDEPAYLDAALRAAASVTALPADRLPHSTRSGVASATTYLEDYAHVIRAMIELARATADTSWIDRASDLAATADAVFADPATGVLYDTPADQPDLFVRPRTTTDGVIPCGASVMLHNLIDLYELTRPGDAAHRALSRAAAILDTLSQAIDQSPVGAANAVRGLLRLLRVFPELRQEPAPPPSSPTPFPVEVFADTDELVVADDQPAVFTLSLRIADHHHINASDPGPASMGLSPLRVGLLRGSGVRIFAEYPPGEPYGAGGELRVHTGQVDFRVVVERDPGATWGAPRIGVTCQPCTDTECLAPRTVELDIDIRRA